MDSAKSSVLNKEIRRKTQGSSSLDVRITGPRERNKTRGSHNREQNTSKSRGRVKDIECNYSGMKGHTKKFCRKLKRENKNKEETNENGNENCLATVTTEDLVTVLDEDMINIACDESRWVMDTGAASHVTSRKNFFSSFTPGDFGTLSMANETVSRVVGIGTICLETSVGTNLVLNNVKHAPDVRLHLISVGVLDDEGYVSTNGDGKWKLIMGSLVVVTNVGVYIGLRHLLVLIW